MIRNLNSTRPFLAVPPLSRPGAWAYADMMEVGRMPYFVEDRTMFGAWVIVSSPLILGHDVTNASQNERVWAVVANPTAISINQAWHGHPGRFVRATKSLQIWAKPTSATSHAAFVFHDGDNATESAEVIIDLNTDLGITIPKGGMVRVRDVWSGQALTPVGALGKFKTALIPWHDSVLLEFSSSKTGPRKRGGSSTGKR